MKKIFNIILVVACLPFFWACETERDNPVALTPDSFVLNTPKYVSGVYDLQNTESIELTTTQPDYGFTAATTYRVQIATQKSFENFVELPTHFNSAKMDVSAKEIALALVELLGATDEADFPKDAFPVYVRLSAELSDGSHKVLSNIVELPRVKSYFALDPMVMPENMYLIGNITDWSRDTATEMVPVWGSEGKFWAVQYLGKSGDDNAQFKFNTTKEWNGTEFGFNQATVSQESITLAELSANDDGNFIVGKPGWYIVVVTTTINGRDYEYAIDLFEPQVYLVGDVIGGVWGAGDTNLFTVPDISLGADAEFVSPTFTGASTDGGVRASIVLPGHEWWHTEFMVFGNELIYRGNGDDQERVAGSPGQKLHINFTKKTGKLE